MVAGWLAAIASDHTGNLLMNTGTERTRTVHGASIGILMLLTRFPRPPGDLGNARSFPFPVLYEVIPGASPHAVVCGDARALADGFIAGARRLVGMGADGIVGNCGFLSLLQPELAAAVNVPVASSPLLQVPLVERLLPPGRRAGILTISASTMSPEHLAAAGVAADIPIMGTEGGAEFSAAILEDRPEIDFDAARRDVVGAARQLADVHPEVGAIVLECTNMSPYAPAIRVATGLPVVTPHAFVLWFQSALRPCRFPTIPGG